MLSDPQTVNSPDMSKQSQNDLIGTVSRQPELEPAAAPIGGSARVIKSSSRRWSTRPLPTRQAPGRIFMHCRSWRERLLLPHIAPAPARCRCVAAGTGSTKHLGRRLTGPPATSHTGPDEGLPRRFVRRQGDTERQGMSVELPERLISRTGIAQRSSQVNWTMIMSSRGWQALHGLAEQPAALTTGIPHGPAVRAPGNSGSRQGGHAGQADRLLAPGLLPFCSPDGPFRCYSPPAGTRSTGLSCGNSRAGSQHPGVYLPALQEVRGPFSRSKYAVDLQKRRA